MSFVDVFLENLEAYPDRAFITEMHGTRPSPTRGGLLREMIEQARGALRDMSVRVGDRVVLVAPNSARWVACDVAILAEGATSVPLYARQAAPELAAMIRDADPRVVLVEDDAQRIELERLCDRPAVSFIPMSALFKAPRAPGLTRAEPLQDAHPVTIIYTSGSSGEPKGVVYTVANVEHMLPVLDQKLRELTGVPGGQDRVFHYLPFCFAGSRMVLWACLFRGNGLFLSMNLEELAQEMQAAAPEYFLNVPALLERVKAGVEAKIAASPLPLRVFYREAVEAFRREHQGMARRRDFVLLRAAKKLFFPRIRRQIGPRILGLICGSAPLAPETQLWFSELLGIPVYQVYGLTETTAIVTMDRVHASVAGGVGYPIPRCDIKLGEDGELLVRGPNVFGGYFRRPEASSAAFTEDGWFRTGDQASIDERGVVHIIGRVKNILVPTSGHNVPPEPLEQMLIERVPGISQAVVMGHARPYLVALMTGTVSRESAERALEQINETLPHYRRIRRYFLRNEPLTIESGLLTANQKLKRQAIEAHFAREIDSLYA